ncbi:MAG: hypothetical protein BJ554DRAFT_5836 [Olpidium bornovanus]|uniref:Uncharacterized protein n=1 Tax=Olpidium bornovanus TaxID=278681 RepID=A0A8H8DKP4_9FUNG|nr:MAG: hypothetical protein BJ554DRAFT_5836 [Olpidium bornovanus]
MAVSTMPSSPSSSLMSSSPASKPGPQGPGGVRCLFPAPNAKDLPLLGLRCHDAPKFAKEPTPSLTWPSSLQVNVKAWSVVEPLAESRAPRPNSPLPPPPPTHTAFFFSPGALRCFVRSLGLRSRSAGENQTGRRHRLLAVGAVADDPPVRSVWGDGVPGSFDQAWEAAKQRCPFKKHGWSSTFHRCCRCG